MRDGYDYESYDKILDEWRSIDPGYWHTIAYFPFPEVDQMTKSREDYLVDALLLEFGDDAESRERWAEATPKFIAEYLRSAYGMGWRKGSTFPGAVRAAFGDGGLPAVLRNHNGDNTEQF